MEGRKGADRHRPASFHHSAITRPRWLNRHRNSRAEISSARHPLNNRAATVLPVQLSLQGAPVRLCLPATVPGPSLDPVDWRALRAQGHQMLDDMFDAMESVGERPLWQPIPDSVRATMRQALPTAPTALAMVHDDFLQQVLPYGSGNTHPGFMGQDLLQEI
eukprot:gene11432-15288_t